MHIGTIFKKQGYVQLLARLFNAVSWLVQYNQHIVLVFIFQVSVFFTESPTNPFLRCVDIALVSKLCHSKGTVVCIDGTFASPVNQKALTFGADLVLHSATKFIAGHNDVSEVQLNHYNFLIGYLLINSKCLCCVGARRVHQWSREVDF